MKKSIKCFLISIFISFSGYSQTYTVIDSINRNEINNYKVLVYEQFFSKNGGTQKQLLKEYKSGTNASKIKINIKPNHPSNIIMFKVIGDDIYDKYIAQKAIKGNKIEVKRKGITDEFYIKLATLRRNLTALEISKIKSEIDVEKISEIKRKDGRYSYVTSPIKDLRTVIDQMGRIKQNYPEFKDAYILHGKSKEAVYFRIQLEVARKWMESEFVNPKNQLEGYFKLDQIKTVDNLYRVVSEKKYDNYKDAVTDFAGKIKSRIPKEKAIIIACKKQGDSEFVITPLSIF